MNLQNQKMITSNEIYRDLCEKIENLVYMPGELLSENELCEVYGTSRHMIRGAFSILRQHKLLEVYPQRGSFVSLIDTEYIADIIYLREAIEQEAASRAIDLGKGDDVYDKMAANLDKQQECLNDKYPNEEFYKLDNEFHMYLLNAVGKKI